MDSMRQSTCLVINPAMVSSLFARQCVRHQTYDDPDLKKKSVGQCLMLVYGLAHRGSTRGLFLTLTGCGTFALFHHSMVI